MRSISLTTVKVTDVSTLSGVQGLQTLNLTLTGITVVSALAGVLGL